MKLRTFLTILVLAAVKLQAEEALVVSTSYRNFLSNAEGNGFLDRLVTEAFTRIGQSVNIVYTPTADSLVDVNAGLLDVEINRIAGMEEGYPNLVRVPEANMVMDFVAFATRDITIDGWASLQGFEVALVRGWKILEENTRDIPGIIVVPTEKELFTMLNKNRIDIALYDRVTGYAVLKDLDIKNVFHLSPPLIRREMYLYLYKEHAALAESLAKALRAIKADGSYDRLMAETSAVYGIPLQ